MDGNLPASPSLGGPNQPPQLIGTPLKRPGLGRLVLGLFVVFFFFTWATFWLDFLGVADVSKLLPFVSSRVDQSKIQEIRKQLNISSVMSSSASVDTLEQLNTAAQKLADTIIQIGYKETVSLEERKIKVGDEVLPIPTFVDSWEIKGVSATISAQYDFDEKKILNIDISILITPIEEVVTNKSSSQVLSRYLLVPAKMQFPCETSPANLTQCHGMISGVDESKLGISLRTGTRDLSGNAKDIITVCQLFSGSNRHAWSSCIHE